MSLAHAFDLVVIGAGSGGLEAAYNAATLYNKRVAVVDVQKSHGPPHYSALGGTCVNVGCVPKKLLVTGAAYAEHFKDAKGFGWNLGDIKHDWKTLMAGKDKVVKDINESYEQMFVDAKMTLIIGWGALQDDHTVVVYSEKGNTDAISHMLTTENILIATGGWPSAIKVHGGELAITSNEAFYLPEAPRNPLVVGGGYIAVEFASIFQSFLPPSTDAHPSLVTLCHRGDNILRGFDNSVRDELRDQLKARGIDVRLHDTPTKIELLGDHKTRRVHFTSGRVSDHDVVMFAIGRHPNTSNLNLADVGVETAADGAVKVDHYSRTNIDNIFAIGDVTNRVQLTPVAIYEGQCVVDTMYGPHARSVHYDAIPSAVFAIPQIGVVGLTEEAAAVKHPRVAVYYSRFAPLMHKMSGQGHKGFLCKVVTDHSTGRVLGVHVCGADAAEIIQGVGIAVKMGAKISDFYTTIGVHPTAAEELCSMRTPAYYLIDGVRQDELPVAAL